MPKVPKSSGAFHFIPHIRRSVLATSKADLLNKYFANNSASAILKIDDVASETLWQTNIMPLLEGLSVEDGEYWNYAFNANGRDIYESLAIGNIEAAAEFEMTSEIVEVLDRLVSMR